MDGLRPPVFLFQGATDDGAIGGNSPLFHRDSLSTFLSIIFPFLCNLWSELKPPRGQWCLALGSDPLLFISNASRYNSFAKMAASKTYLQQNIWVESSSFLYFSPFLLFSFDEVWFLVGRGSREGVEYAGNCFRCMRKVWKEWNEFFKRNFYGKSSSSAFFGSSYFKRNLS